MGAEGISRHAAGRVPWIGFLAAAGAMWAAGLAARARFDELPDAGLVAAALVVDLGVIVPALFWWLVVRRLGAPVLWVAPVFLASVAALTALLPQSLERPLAPLEAVAVGIELAVLTFLGTRVVGFLRVRRHSGRGGEGVVSEIRAAAARLAGSGRAAEVLAYEGATLYFAFFGWHATADAAATDAANEAFTCHRHNQYGHLLAALVGVAAIEMVAVHLVLLRFELTTIAWVATGLSAYAVVWLLGDWNALRRRPVRLESGGLALRVGLRWEARVPYENIASLTPLGPDAAPPELSLAACGKPNLLLELRRPANLVGAYGLRRQARRIGLGMDDAGAFAAALAQRRD